MMTPFICRGCQQPIMERYLMKVLDKSWHMHCVKCCECQCILSEQCYSRDSKLYCRNDFFKLFGTKCSGCNQGLCPEDLVRHAMNKVYHVPCFLCSMCRKQMMTGEQVYLVQGDAFLCERCHQLTQSISVKTSIAASSSTTSVGTPKSVEVPAQSVAVALAQSPMQQHVTSQLPSQQQQTPQQPQQTTPAPNSDGRRSKTRTSINPVQLEVLMQTYAHEQRPSKHVREELMAKTGLDMKVIQVWFQNRRSKEKRDASYREAGKEETPAIPTPIETPPTATPPPPAAATTTSNIATTAISLASSSPISNPVAATANGQENT